MVGEGERMPNGRTGLRSESGHVITKAEGKCKTILEKVKTEQSAKGPIYKQAQELKNNATTLLTAAQSAKKTVESKVTLALEAVVKMDESLKMDLFDVKKKIKDGIKEVINSSGLNDLGENVKTDLVALRGKILGLKEGVDTDRSNVLLKEALSKLDTAKTKFNEDTGKISTETKNLESNFDTHIKTPLKEKLQQVDSAIEQLGEKFEMKNGQKAKNFAEIFKHIKDRVGEIKGNGRQKKGLDGIVARFQTYVREVGNNMKKELATTGTVHAWLDSILKHNGVVVYRLRNINSVNKNALHETFSNQTKEKLRDAKVYIEAERQHPIPHNGTLAERLASLKNLIEKYASVLDGTINNGTNDFVTGLVGMIETQVRNYGTSPPDRTHLTPTVEAVLAALTADARRTAGEINSLLLSGNVAKMLDNMTTVVHGLHGQLDKATAQPVPSGDQPKAGTAQAVDSRLKAVREMVEKELTAKFTEVKKDLQQKVQELPTAVDTFNTAAEKQIKEAAQTAYFPNFLSD
ncbi:Extracellular matrix-binding ebh, putative [Babesia ovata]|uniref:Extracellular matrix-binding ebh, putative n=1 Tax=Babesia ovata TaxID=189622 RepID=A0A2H6KD81_9APIC|nr:Extracellular matrix-binding ebh, putative [Babesia ovata]GBE60943.1 Extracellular matrix-binding ebh, putative [Babesia ovata]